jgi:hypothetical protein
MAAKPKNTNTNKKQGNDKALFAISLPERTVRSVLGTAGHTAREITHVVVPPAVRKTKFWNAAIERSLKILAEGVGHVRAEDPDAPPDDIARMAVGSVVDTAALVVFQFSPLWFLAIVNDVAKGSREYLDEVVYELRAQGALDKNVKIEGVDHLLSVLERTSGRLQTDVDKPPLSVDQLRSSVDELRNAFADVKIPEIAAGARELETELKITARKEGLTLREVSNAIALELASHARLARVAAKTSLDVAKRKFREGAWKPYIQQLRRVQKLGFAKYLAGAAAPLAEAMNTNFNPGTDTVTAQLVSGRLWKSAMETLRKSRGKSGGGSAAGGGE